MRAIRNVHDMVCIDHYKPGPDVFIRSFSGERRVVRVIRSGAVVPARARTVSPLCTQRTVDRRQRSLRRTHTVPPEEATPRPHQGNMSTSH